MVRYQMASQRTAGAARMFPVCPRAAVSPVGSTGEPWWWRSQAARIPTVHTRTRETRNGFQTGDRRTAPVRDRPLTSPGRGGRDPTACLSSTAISPPAARIGGGGVRSAAAPSVRQPGAVYCRTIGAGARRGLLPHHVVAAGDRGQGVDDLVGQPGPLIGPLRGGLDADDHLLAVDLLEQDHGWVTRGDIDLAVEDLL